MVENLICNIFFILQNMLISNFITQICYNEPKTSEKKETVKVGYPVANKKCENQPVSWTP